MPGMEPVVRAARPDDDGGRGAALRLGRAVLRPLCGRRGARPAHAGRGLPARGPHGELGGVPRGAGGRRGRRGARRLPGGRRTRSWPAASSASRSAACRRGGCPGSCATCAPPRPSRPGRRAGCCTSTRWPWRPRWRRRGVARALLAEADRLAAAQGLRGVALDTGIENRAARALYQRSGFRPGRAAPGARRAQRPRHRRLGLRRLRQAARLSDRGERVGDALDLRPRAWPGRTAGRASGRRSPR